MVSVYGADAGRVGYVGLGDLGLPMAVRLVDLPKGLTVFDVDPASAAPLIERGATMAASVAHLGERCDVVSVGVPGDEPVRAVVGELLTTLAPRAVVAVHSTIRPETAEQMAAEAAHLGVHVLDAAISGGPVSAEQGLLALLVGGDAEGVATALPVLDRLGDLVVHLGPAGAGSRGLLARNLLHYVSFAAAGEAARLAEAAGIDPVVLGQIVRHSDALMGGPGAMMRRSTTEPMQADDPWRELFTKVWSLGETDLHLAVEMASRLGVATPLADIALRELGPALGLGPAATDGPEDDGRRRAPTVD